MVQKHLDTEVDAATGFAEFEQGNVVLIWLSSNR